MWDHCAIKHVCTDLGIGWANAEVYTSSSKPDLDPVLAEDSRFALGGAAAGRGWWEGIMGWRESISGQGEGGAVGRIGSGRVPDHQQQHIP